MCARRSLSGIPIHANQSVEIFLPSNRRLIDATLLKDYNYIDGSRRRGQSSSMRQNFPKRQKYKPRTRDASLTGHLSQLGQDWCSIITITITIISTPSYFPSLQSPDLFIDSRRDDSSAPCSFFFPLHVKRRPPFHTIYISCVHCYR